MRYKVLQCGSGERYGPGEYRCVRRLRLRRLLTFLWLQGFESSFALLTHETDVLFSVPYLGQLVSLGLWENAIKYLCRLLKLPSTSSTHQDHLCDEAQVVLHFLRTHRTFAGLIAGKKDSFATSELCTQYLNNDNTVCPGAIRIRSIVFPIMFSEQIRGSLDWEGVRLKAAQIVTRMVYKIPELDDTVHLPCSLMKPQNVLPIGFGFRPRRHVKKLRRPRASALAKFYLRKKKRLPSSTPFQDVMRGFSTDARNMLADLLDESLKAGKRPELPQSSGKEGAPVSQAMFGTFTSPTGNSGISSVINTGAAVSQTKFDTLTSPAKNSDTISVTNAGPAENSEIPSEIIASTNKHLTQEGCYTESAGQGFKSRKNPELTIAEEYIDTKRQRTTGPFGEANMATVIDLGAEDRSPVGTDLDLAP